MTLKSALQDLKENTLAAVSGLLAKLVYLASLRRHGDYQHWGLEMVHGREATERALRTAHSEAVTRVLRTPLARLEEDLEQSSQSSGMPAQAYAEKLRGHVMDLLPEGRQNSTAPSHLNSVLVALSSLERNRERATRLIS
jgi:ElaB/YqjD/DUF883 family membrane-anchored ribosome-binding protein